MRRLTPSAPSLRQFEHIDEIYKKHLLPADCPRTYDYAEIIRSHCRPETGQIVKVLGDPHWCMIGCADCNEMIKEWIVQVEPITDWENLAARNPAPYFMPITWLKRWEKLDPKGK